eukprot:NODE_3209_length_1023_cov_33.862423_g2951_i0.p2 GENE.NODE_3209_length_1023_cov_33.862423_g2951_i0~~NODE_3209_length_1023_cov_33.862423_g2951_i0.p2  ORF type:complete len:113 (+),score=11.34 NODE_3209_length_1023_cov_33.862423_g2951_i0:513-851(+)
MVTRICLFNRQFELGMARLPRDRPCHPCHSVPSLPSNGSFVVGTAAACWNLFLWLAPPPPPSQPPSPPSPPASPRVPSWFGRYLSVHSSIVPCSSLPAHFSSVLEEYCEWLF